MNRENASRTLRSLLWFALGFALLALAHAPLLKLPYYWDEAGYYIPAARDLWLNGSLIPLSVPSNAHPPLVMAYLALIWKIAGYKLVVTRVGDENVQGQNCVKNKVIATGPDGIPHESTVWSATDLNNFPIKIETVQKGATVILLFRDLKLEAPDAAQFNPPADYKQYDDFRSLISSRAGTPTPR